METLKIYQKWEDMLAYLYPAVRAYPKAALQGGEK